MSKGTQEEDQYKAEIQGQQMIEENHQGFAAIDPNELDEGPDIPPPDVKGTARRFWSWLKRKF